MLHIPRTTFTDFGNYKCNAENKVGSKDASYLLKGQPSIPKYVADKQTNYKNITLIWEIESESPIAEHEIIFRKKGVNSSGFLFVSSII